MEPDTTIVDQVEKTIEQIPKLPDDVREVNQFVEASKEFLSDVLFNNIPKIVIALLILWIGWKLVKLISKAIDKMMTKKNRDVSLKHFLISLINIALKTLLLITAVSMMGIPTTSFITIIGAAGLAIGMALQGTLQNFAGGVIILLLRPFKVGDFIEQGNYYGTVQEIRIFNTILTTVDNTDVIIPNTELATKTLINYTRTDFRRLNVRVGIAYGESIEKAKNIMLKLANEKQYTLHAPEAYDPYVCVTELGSSSVNLELRLWVKNNDWGYARSELNQAVYERFNEEHVEIPFNQLQVHINNNKE